MRYWKSYLEVHSKHLEGKSYPQEEEAHVIVVIPVFDEPGLLTTLKSLYHCTQPPCNVLVAVIINSGQQASKAVVRQNRITHNEVLAFAKTHNTPNRTFYPLLFENLPKKHAGVGLARKLGMDLAIKHFYDFSTPDGIIVSLDADCTIDPNYLTAIHAAYTANPKLQGTIHPVTHRLEKPDPLLEKSIREYEAYLRYFQEMLKEIKFPYPYQTIGSAFSVAARSYVKVGGMGRQQGGEDFYFLQKLFQVGEVKELLDVNVYPLARSSDRVPFGTGPALQKMMDETNQPFEVYSRCSFRELGKLFALVEHYAKNDSTKKMEILEQGITALHPSLVAYLDEIRFKEIIQDCKNNTSRPGSFMKRFFHHFNAFRIIKYLNHVHPRPFERESMDDLIQAGVISTNIC